jgi:antirestriction protein
MIKIYVVNLGKYNEGKLVGKWLELPCDMEDFKDSFLPSIEIDNIQYEEYAIHDYETDIEGLNIGEYSNIEELSELAEAYDNLTEDEQKTFSAILEWNYYSANSIKEAIENVDSFRLIEEVTDDKSYGEYIIENGLMGDIPENLIMYLDEEAIGRDWYINGNSFYSSYGLIERC